jgi:4-hydroxy-tetrahydrodipicolinate synthase
VNGVDADTLRLLAGAPSDFAVLCGDDAFILALLLMGASGAIAASAHLCTERFAALVAAADAGRVDEAREQAEALLGLVLALFAEPSPAVLKAMLHDAGRIATPALRMPLQAASPAGLERARRSAPSRSSGRAPARAR